MKALPTFTPALALRLFRTRTEATPSRSSGSHSRMCRRILKRMQQLPGLTVFDQLDCSLEENRIVLRGQVVRPQLRKEAELLASRIAGDRPIDNRIELLPATPYDERIRLSIAAAVFTHPSLRKYSQAGAPLRILVKDGAVTLAGRVASSADRLAAAVCASGVSGVPVQNQLTVSS